MNNLIKYLRSMIVRGDILLIVPPFVTCRSPIMGPHILQAITRQQGLKADVLHLNLLLASKIGVEEYESICFGQPYRMLGERLFARSAYQLPPLGKDPELCDDPVKSVFGDKQKISFDTFEYKYYRTKKFSFDALLELEKMCYELIDEISQTIVTAGYKMVGCSSNWEQNNCSIALLNRIKKKNSQVLTLMGGSNCEEEMAEGIASVSNSIDYIFSGESEEIYAKFLNDYSQGQLPTQRILKGQPVENLDAVPLPDFQDYFDQVNCFFPGDQLKGIAICIETSRGCWYNGCRFCGLNGKRRRFRQKSPETAMAELEDINARYPDKRIIVIDKVMPPLYKKELLPQLPKDKEQLHISFSDRPDLEFNDLLKFKKAGIHLIKPGIEALSTGVLNAMNKGVTACQNLLLLRNARSVGIWISWNLLWGLPGETIEDYEETLKLLPLIRHLNPPDVFRHISIDRFCTYFEKPGKYHIHGLRPWAVYRSVYPDYGDVDKLAYRFTGDYPNPSYDHPELLKKISMEVDRWKKVRKIAKLDMCAYGDSYLIYDSRDNADTKCHILDFKRAKEIMTYCLYNESHNQEWALEKKLGAVVDSYYVPLVTASTGLLMEWETGGTVSLNK